MSNIEDTFQSSFLSVRDVSSGGVTVRLRAMTTNRIYSELFLIEASSSCSNSGDDGSFYSQSKMTTSLSVQSGGAEGTGKALFLSNKESTKTITGRCSVV